MVLLLACAASTEAPGAPAAAGPPVPAAPAAPSLTPDPLRGDWYLTESYQGRRVVAKPCAADLGHLVLQDGKKGAEVAARRVLAVRIGYASAVSGGSGRWTYAMGAEPPWTFSFLDPAGRMLRWEGGGKDIVGPWVRSADLDAWEYLALPESACKRPDPLPVWPEGLARQWWQLQWHDGRWMPAPEPGTLPPLEVSSEGGWSLVLRTGAGERRHPLVVLGAEGDRVDLTLLAEDGSWLGARIDDDRPAPPPGEVDAEGGLGPISAVSEVGLPLPEGARFITLPGRPAYTAGVWAPAEVLARLGR